MPYRVLRSVLLLSLVACGCEGARTTPADAPLPDPVDAPDASAAPDAGAVAPPDSGPEPALDPRPDAGAAGGAPGYPNPDWYVGDPSAHGLDPAMLDAAGAAAERLHSHCLLVIRDGALVYERYYDGAGPDSVHRSWSIAKSYAGTAVGIALGRGELGTLDDPVADYVPEWADGEHDAITIRDIVSMTSGLEWSVWQDYARMATLASDHSGYALGLSVDVPAGTTWTYHNGGVQVLEPLIRHATGITIEEYAERHLWSRIGMRASWAHDRAGNPTAYANVEATCRDHARFGYLYLRGGVWNGEQVVPEAWVREALVPSQDQNRGYGFLFWLNGEAPTRSALNEDSDEEIAPFAPDDLFAARGFGNQFIDVIPSLDLVVVRFGADPRSTYDPAILIDDARFEVHDEILGPILAAVR